MLCISLSLENFTFISVRPFSVCVFYTEYVKNCIIRTENDRHTENFKQLYKLPKLFASMSSLASAGNFTTKRPKTIVPVQQCCF